MKVTVEIPHLTNDQLRVLGDIYNGYDERLGMGYSPPDSDVISADALFELDLVEMNLLGFYRITSIGITRYYSELQVHLAREQFYTRRIHSR